MKSVCIIIRNEYKTFYIALARLISKSCSVRILVDNPSVNSLIRERAPELTSLVTVLPERRELPQVYRDTVSIAAENEKRLGEKFAIFCAKDRAFGRGYMSNIDGYPYFERESWSHEQRLAALNLEVATYEKHFVGIDALVSQWPESVPSAICDARAIQHFHLLPVKLACHFYWSTDSYKGSDELRSALTNFLDTFDEREIIPTRPYEADAASGLVISQISYGILAACKASLTIIRRDIINALRGRRKINSVRVFGWVPSRWRKVRNYNFVKKHGATSVENDKYHYIFFPLHMEPEVSLYLFSPEFINTFEALVWLSKALPADWQIVVKEQPNAFQFRSRSFYKRLMQIGNVQLASPDTSSWDWIQKSDGVAVFTSTVGIEAVHFEKPVISFSRRQFINHLPTVFEAFSYEDTVSAFIELREAVKEKKKLVKARAALYAAQREVSFALPDMPGLAKSNSSAGSTAKAAYDQLVIRYPHIFG